MWNLCLKWSNNNKLNKGIINEYINWVGVFGLLNNEGNLWIMSKENDIIMNNVEMCFINIKWYINYIVVYVK